jgi:hypothetical protein
MTAAARLSGILRLDASGATPGTIRFPDYEASAMIAALHAVGISGERDG